MADNTYSPETTLSQPGDKTYRLASSSDPARHIAAVTPADGTDLPGGTTRSLLIGAAGNIKVTTAGGETVTVAVPAGYNPFAVTRVWATGTTATGIVALW